MKIFAIGMNYAEHNKELRNALHIMEQYERKTVEPVIFTKADSALLKDGKPFFVPDFMGRIDYETELVVRICRLGKAIPARFAHRYYDAVTVGIDFTARDVQRKAKELGRPWTIAKGFDGSAVIGQWVMLDDQEAAAKEQGAGNTGQENAAAIAKGEIQNLNFRLDINGNTVQEGFSREMLYTVDEIIEYISKFFTLKTGDLIYTGTPSGVGPIKVGDHVEGWLEGTKVLEFNCR